MSENGEGGMRSTERLVMTITRLTKKIRSYVSLIVTIKMIWRKTNTWYVPPAHRQAITNMYIHASHCVSPLAASDYMT